MSLSERKQRHILSFQCFLQRVTSGALSASNSPPPTLNIRFVEIPVSVPQWVYVRLVGTAIVIMPSAHWKWFTVWRFGESIFFIDKLSVAILLLMRNHYAGLCCGGSRSQPRWETRFFPLWQSNEFDRLCKRGFKRIFPKVIYCESARKERGIIKCVKSFETQQPQKCQMHAFGTYWTDGWMVMMMLSNSAGEPFIHNLRCSLETDIPFK